MVNGDTTLHQTCALAAKRIQNVQVMLNALRNASITLNLEKQVDGFCPCELNCNVRRQASYYMQTRSSENEQRSQPTNKKSQGNTKAKLVHRRRH